MILVGSPNLYPGNKMATHMLNLAEELFLLSINDEKGVVHASAMPNLRYGLSGAMLADLTIQEKLGLDDKKHVSVLDSGLSGDEILDEALVCIARSDRPRRATFWISELSQLRACKMLDLVFTKDERKAARNRIEQIGRNEVFGIAVIETLEAIESAAIAAILAATSV